MDSITTRFDFVDKEMSYKQALEAILSRKKRRQRGNRVFK